MLCLYFIHYSFVEEHEIASLPFFWGPFIVDGGEKTKNLLLLVVFPATSFIVSVPTMIIHWRLFLRGPNRHY